MSSDASDEMMTLLKELSVYKVMDEEYRDGSRNQADIDAHEQRGRRRHEIGQAMQDLAAESKSGPAQTSADETRPTADSR